MVLRWCRNPRPMALEPGTIGLWFSTWNHRPMVLDSGRHHRSMMRPGTGHHVRFTRCRHGTYLDDLYVVHHGQWCRELAHPVTRVDPHREAVVGLVLRRVPDGNQNRLQCFLQHVTGRSGLGERVRNSASAHRGGRDHPPADVLV